MQPHRWVQEFGQSQELEMGWMGDVETRCLQDVDWSSSTDVGSMTCRGRCLCDSKIDPAMFGMMKENIPHLDCSLTQPNFDVIVVENIYTWFIFVKIDGNE